MQMLLKVLKKIKMEIVLLKVILNRNKTVMQMLLKVLNIIKKRRMKIKKNY